MVHNISSEEIRNFLTNLNLQGRVFMKFSYFHQTVVEWNSFPYLFDSRTRLNNQNYHDILK